MNDKEEALMLYQMYLDAYMDPTVSRDILKTYFEVIPPKEFFDLRDKMLSSGDQIELVAGIGPDVCIGTYAQVISNECSGRYLFIYDIINGDEKHRHIEPVLIRKRIDQSTPLLSIVDPDDDGDGIPTEEKLDVLGVFMNNLNDDTHTMEDFFVQLMTRGTDDTTCPLSSPQHCSKAEGYYVDSIDLVEVNGFSFIQIRQTPDLLTSELEDIDVSYFIYFYYNDEGNLMFELVPMESIPSPVQLPVFTLEELAQYTGANGSAAYIAVDGVVYDVTEVFDNGEHKGMKLGGTDATSVFASSPHSASFLSSLTVVGTLEETR